MSTSTGGTVRYVDGLLEELSRQAPLALLEGRTSAVHKARVATRRLGAALQLLSPLLPQDAAGAMGRSLKRIRRSVQQLRDMDVMQEHLAAFIEQGTHAGAAERFATEMAQRRRESAAQVAEVGKLQKWLAKLGLWVSVRGMLLGKPEEIARAVRQALLEQHSAFAAAADRLAERLTAATPGASPVEPHALRIAGKALRYTLEIAQSEEMPVSGETLKRYKAMQEVLGLWHDYHVLAQEILQLALEEMGQGGYRGDEDELVHLAAAVLARSHEQLAEFARLWMESRGPIADEITKVTAEPTPAPAPSLPPAPAPAPVAAELSGKEAPHEI